MIVYKCRKKIYSLQDPVRKKRFLTRSCYTSISYKIAGKNYFLQNHVEISENSDHHHARNRLEILSKILLRIYLFLITNVVLRWFHLRLLFFVLYFVVLAGYPSNKFIQKILVYNPY
jgi:hypothetical protein